VMSRNVIVVLAGLMGAAGVALGAVAAHRVQDPALATASQMLVLHAAAALAVTAHLRRVHHQLARGFRIWLVGGVLLLAGAGLFCGDIALRSMIGGRLFPMAAPVGGSTMIAGWLMLAMAGLVSLRGAEK
jgi:uncharacterized membrane protein YgdD (TMEM256/DUF423 family)